MPVGKFSISIVDPSVKLDLCLCMVMIQGVVYLFRYLLHWTPMIALLVVIIIIIIHDL